MAMPRSQLAALFLAVLVTAAPVVRAAAAGAYAVDNLQDACNKTLFPKVCIQALTTNPESRTANARRLAELSVYVAAEVGTAVAAFAHHELNGVKEDSLFKCVDSCSDDIEEAVAHLSALTRELTDAKFLEVKAWLSATLGGSSTCEDTCKDAPISDIKNAVVTKSLEFEKLLRVTLDLITEASGSMSAGVAVPPTAWDASGAPGPSPPGPSESFGSANAPGPSPPGSSESFGSANAPGPSPPEDSASYGAAGSAGPSPSGAAGSPGPSPSGAAAPGPATATDGPTAAYTDVPSPSPSIATSPSPSPGSAADAPKSGGGYADLAPGASPPDSDADAYTKA
ncbi:mucin-1-like [Oryza brachyantha]|uniref:mucin-1-like n=1 Tax=Oryza brachyantha TaxID=4533 RepID=UPI001ADAEE7C|nr:mucin-1-like [Oryza brachyantha]